MNDWASGYVVDTEYTYGYYAELNPLRARIALLHAGFAAPDVRTACELGFGQGVSVNFHAAGSAVQWWGTDFAPGQVKFAQDCAAAARADARLYDQAFIDFCAREDLPEFDYIGLHGIWSWITSENQAAIVEFIRRKLKVGGVLYISYNTMPGWAPFAPMQRLFLEHAEVMAAPGRGVLSRFDAALVFAERLVATKPRYTQANPSIHDRVQKIREVNRTYATHEYLCAEWRPVPFADMARALEPAKMQYACSAHYLDHVDAVNLTADQQALLDEIPDAMFRQTIRDFIVNRQFRRDFWVKGLRRMPLVEQAESLRRQRVMLTSPRSDVSLKVRGAVIEASMQESIYTPILDVLADHQPRTVAQTAQAIESRKISFAQLIQAIMVLLGKSALEPVQEPEVTRKAKPHTDRLNAYLIDLARGGGEITGLASPVTGGGLLVGRAQQLFLLARAQGRKQPEDWADYCWQILSAQGHRVIKDGKKLMTADENLADLAGQARAFADKLLPIMKAMEIA
jgi:SAM-dependent methyltransferase